MCGIAGSFHFGSGTPLSTGDMERALTCLAHRGPDDEGLLQKGSVVLGHRRLSIIDTSAAGHQPFIDESGRYAMVFNGEVFNFQELRSDLEAQGEKFSSRTDTEVVLRLFMLKGPEFLHDLNGFFALAIHDSLDDSLFLARDRFGIKPLLWCVSNGGFLFSSELRGLLAMGAPAQLDEDSRWTFFRYHYIAAPRTILKDVHKMLPGHSMTITRQGPAIRKWYDLDEEVKRIASKGRPDGSTQLFELMDNSVRLRLISDVPIGTFLSGGLDSSIVSALAKRHKADLRTFSIGYADDPYFDETRYAEEVAAHIGSDHTTFKLSREELASSYTELIDSLDEPFADSSALPSLILCRHTRKHVTVALSGDGADELFGGYRKHQAALLMQHPGPRERLVIALAPLWRVLPRSRDSAWTERFRQLDRFAQAARLEEKDRYMALAAFEEMDVVDRLTERHAPEHVLNAMSGAFLEQDGIDAWLRNDLELVLPNDMLHKVDLTSMAFGLEVRTPFLDKNVVEFATGAPAEEKLTKGMGKLILRSTFKHILPASVIHRPKKGFEVPLRDLFLGPLAGHVERVLDRGTVIDSGLSWPEVQAVRRRMGSTDPGSSQATVHALLVYISWWRRHGQRRT